MRKFNSLLLAIVIAISSIFTINITENAKPVLASGTTQNYKKIDYYTSGKVKGVTYYFEESGNQVKKHNGLHDTETSTYNIYSQKNGKSKCSFRYKEKIQEKFGLLHKESVKKLESL